MPPKRAAKLGAQPETKQFLQLFHGPADNDYDMSRNLIAVAFADRTLGLSDRGTTEPGIPRGVLAFSCAFSVSANVSATDAIKNTRTALTK